MTLADQQVPTPAAPGSVRGRVPVLTHEDAVAAAAAAAVRLAEGAAARDAERRLPEAELDELSAAGLLAVTVPAADGGAGLGAVTLAEVVRLLATGDPNVAQLPQSHFAYVRALAEQGTPDQRRHLLGEVLAGARFGNAQSELGTRTARDVRTTLRPDPARPGDWLLSGDKAYATGALLAHWIPVLAHLGEDGPLHVAWVRRDAAGVTVTDDWDGMGQRTTASGSVSLVDVAVPAEQVTPWHLTFDRPQVYGATAQLVHAAIDTGIARGALTEAAAFVVDKSRPHADAGVERAADDPLVQQAVGQVEVAVRAAEALLRTAAEEVDAADAALAADPSDPGGAATRASLAVAAVRAASTQASLEASTRLFEVAGTRAALDRLNLHRHWRNARTHTLHDPAAWKVQHLGRWVLDGTPPPNHGQI